MNSYRVIVTSPCWHLSGVNTVSANLVRGLRARGVDAELLLTQDPGRHAVLMPPPPKLPLQRLPVPVGAGWRRRWQALTDYLEARAPCVYLPNYDWECSAICPMLSNGVVVVGSVHSDEPIYYQHMRRLGQWWNAIVAVSKAIERQIAAVAPDLKDRVSIIPYGVEAPDRYLPRDQTAGRPLKVIFASRLIHYQKRVFDLPVLMECLESRNVPVELTVVGAGVDEPKLRSRSERFTKAGTMRFLGSLPNEDVLKLFAQSDVILLTSDFEGMPLTLLEAMGRGCVPVVTDMRSGIPELVQNGVNGYRVPIGHMSAMARHLHTLYSHPERREFLGRQAFQTIQAGRYRTQDMVGAYAALFERALEDVKDGVFRRQNAPLVIPPNLTPLNRLRAFLGNPLQRIKGLLLGTRLHERVTRKATPTPKTAEAVRL